MSEVERRTIKVKFGLVLLVLTSVLIAGRATAIGAGKKSVYVSLVTLLVSGSKYEGQNIQVKGFVCVDFESEALYLHEEDYRQGLTKNALALRLSRGQRDRFRHLNLKYVVLQGRFYSSGPEVSEANSGAIGKITMMQEWKPALPSPLSK